MPLNKHLFSIFIILPAVFGIKLEAQTYVHSNRWQVDSLIIAPSSGYRFTFPENHYPLVHTLNIRLKNRNLQPELDYRLEDERSINLFGMLNAGDTLFISYRRQPFNLRGSYVLFEKDSLLQSGAADTSWIDSSMVRLKEVKFENPFANLNTALQTSGSIMRGVQIGTNRDLSLNSGLNVELAGNLAENLEIVAVLTDEATPIQPEGNTQTLKEIDKVYVQFKSPYVLGTVGDFNLRYGESQFANINRKLQGLTVTGNYASKFLGGTIATTRGFFSHMEFIGQEGNQGPYQLTGKNGETNIVVLAGTERLWINGRLMIRGESNDYIVEYGNGQITFTNRRLVTAESRIEIDFEYFPVSQKYNRNVYGGIGGASLFNGDFKIDMRYFREVDDPDQTLQEGGSLTDEEKEIIGNAGDDPLKAYVSGATLKGDSSANYIKIDTTIEAQPYSYYKYAGKDNGNYQVYFSYTGIGNGDYVRDRLGVYIWKGIGKGEYAPVRLLPLPMKQELADIKAGWRVSDKFNINTEYAITRLDKNTLSDSGDTDNQGQAFFVRADLDKSALKIGGLNLGTMSINLSSRYIEKQFEAPDRISQPDFQRYWNIVQDARGDNEELSVQFNGHFNPVEALRIEANAGQLAKTGFSSKRYAAQMDFNSESWFKGGVRAEYVSSKIEKENLKNDWWRYRANLLKDIWKFQPQLSFRSEIRKNKTPLVLSGFEFEEYGAKVGLIKWKYFSGALNFSRRLDLIYDVEEWGRLAPLATTTTKQLDFILHNLPETSLSLHLIRREKIYAPEFKNVKVDTLKSDYVDPAVQDTVWQDRSTDLAELNFTHSRWKKAVKVSLQYRISTRQTALKEKIYIDVGVGRGNLRYDEALGEYVPDADGNYVLFILPSGKFKPVTNLQTSIRLNIEPGKYWQKPPAGIKNMLSLLSSETYFRIDEETREQNLRSVYLLDLSKFQGDSTVRGTLQLNEDLFIMRRNRDLSFRVRYRYNSNRINQYLDANENEDFSTEEFGLRGKWRLIKSIRSQSEIRRKLTFRNSESNSFRNRDITGFYLAQDFSYRPNSQWEFGIEGEYGQEDNISVTYPIKLWSGSFKGRISYSLPGRGRLSAEFDYLTVKPTQNIYDLSIPYEMARGKKEGVSQNWNLRAEYTVAQNILLTLFYNGRDDAGFKQVIHSGQAEIRAFF